MNIVETVAALITEDVNHINDYFAAVACPEDGKGRFLLGLSTASDDRKGTWCFPGGHIEDGESPRCAAIRECLEETGVTAEPIWDAFTVPDKCGVAFLHCHIPSNPILKPNGEFKELGLFSPAQMRNMNLYKNVMELVRRCW